MLTFIMSMFWIFVQSASAAEVPTKATLTPSPAVKASTPTLNSSTNSPTSSPTSSRVSSSLNSPTSDSASSSDLATDDGSGAGKVYGTTDFAPATVKLAQVLQDFQTYRNQPITIEGKVQQVCEEKGCWIKVEDQNLTVRAIMKGHAFSVPKELRNKKVKMTGIMEQKELPVKVVRHYMKDEGRSEEEIKKVNAPQKVFQFIVDGIKEI